MDDLIKTIEQSALQTVMVDGSDLSGLAGLHSKFQSISEIASSSNQAPPDVLEVIRQASTATAGLIEKIILAEIPDVDDAIATITTAANTLQQLILQISQGKGFNGISFPAELGIVLPAEAAPKAAKTRFSITLPDNVDEDIFNEFVANLPHVLDSLEATILNAEQDNTAENRAAIKAILHNLKGESALMGLTEMSSLCHESESLLVNATQVFPAEKLFANKDWLQKACSVLQGKEVDAEIETPTETITPVDSGIAPAAALPNGESLIIAEGDIPLVMDFVGESNEHLETAESHLLSIEENPQDDDTLNAIFRSFHTIKGVAGFLNLKQIGSLAHATENLLDLGRKGTLVLNPACIDVLFEAIDLTKQLLAELLKAVESHQPILNHNQVGSLIERIKACSAGAEPEARIGEILIEKGVPQQEVRQALKEQRTVFPEKKIGEILVAKSVTDPETVSEALNEQETSKDRRMARMEKKAAAGESTVKVTTSRLDALINMVGELVIAQSMVSQDLCTNIQMDRRLARNTRHLEKITRDLQDLTMSMRMVPVQGVFQKMTRLVRDLSRKSNKQVEMFMTGAETELDRNVVEVIADPLVHMIRNSVDHGIEPPDERRAAGKNPSGRIGLHAFHQAGNIVIEISDDGRGLNREKILQKAIESGIVREGQELTDSEIHHLIFHAGLSTAEKVTDISGRGVGMDVVRKNIESLRGRIDIISEPGKGSTFSIRLPLTLAVIDGQIVTVGKEKFIIPTISIEQSLKPQPGQITDVQGKRAQVIKVRNQLLPLVKLHQLFGIAATYTDPCDSLVVVAVDGLNRCCLQVDSLLGQQQVVIKSLGDFFGSLKGVSGGAIMGDGNVSLILDVPGLIQLAVNS